MIRKHGHRLAFLSCFVGLMLATIYSCSKHEAPEQVACTDIVAGCALPKSGWHVRFDHTPKPMELFQLRATLPGARNVQARFMMQGMEMGLNRYRLQPANNGNWHGEVFLPACIQGRKDWILILETDNRQFALPFRSQ